MNIVIPALAPVTAVILDFIPGTWTGVLVSLIVGAFLSRKVIKKHQDNSQFKL